ncbi:MAG: ferredoxin [Candidatus Aenigmarchaeota archaeon]|nr:ferredoxin [Candidatus Aenigmarchaeota archaeon]
MKTFRVEHDRPSCIGCGACAAVAPEFWEMKDPDGKSDLVGGKKIAGGKKEREIDEKSYSQNRAAADVCPVNVIHIFEKGKKLV